MKTSSVAKPSLSKLSLEKYAAICTLLKGGHDVASSIPLGELKEVHRSCHPLDGAPQFDRLIPHEVL